MMTRGLSQDDRLRYVRSKKRGKGAAMNEGLMLGRSEFVVCTDDDCEAPPNWVAGMATILDQHPEVGAVFSNVVAGPHDPSKGYVPTFERTSDRLLRSVLGNGGSTRFRSRNGPATGRSIGPWRDGRGSGPRRSVSALPMTTISNSVSSSGAGLSFRRPSSPSCTTASAALPTDASTSAETGLPLAHTLENSGCAGHPSAVLLALWVLGRFALFPQLNDGRARTTATRTRADHILLQRVCRWHQFPRGSANHDVPAAVRGSATPWVSDQWTGLNVSPNGPTESFIHGRALAASLTA